MGQAIRNGLLADGAHDLVVVEVDALQVSLQLVNVHQVVVVQLEHHFGMEPAIGKSVMDPVQNRQGLERLIKKSVSKSRLNNVFVI